MEDKRTKVGRRFDVTSSCPVDSGRVTRGREAYTTVPSSTV